MAACEWIWSLTSHLPPSEVMQSARHSSIRVAYPRRGLAAGNRARLLSRPAKSQRQSWLFSAPAGGRGAKLFIFFPPSHYGKGCLREFKFPAWSLTTKIDIRQFFCLMIRVWHERRADCIIKKFQFDLEMSVPMPGEALSCQGAITKRVRGRDRKRQKEWCALYLSLARRYFRQGTLRRLARSYCESIPAPGTLRMTLSYIYFLPADMHVATLCCVRSFSCIYLMQQTFKFRCRRLYYWKFAAAVCARGLAVVAAPRKCTSARWPFSCRT